MFQQHEAVPFVELEPFAFSVSLKRFRFPDRPDDFAKGGIHLINAELLSVGGRSQPFPQYLRFNFFARHLDLYAVVL